MGLSRNVEILTSGIGEWTLFGNRGSAEVMKLFRCNPSRAG